jgi:hypothetical protein
MMMKDQLSPRDLEMLSAYLDGQLSTKEIAHLQARLQTDQQLQMALEDLRLTRAALRSLPRLRAPRNFTLTPEMAGVHPAKRRQAYPAFGIASLVATLLLALVFFADRTSFFNTAQTAALQSAAESTQMEQLVQTMVVERLATEGVAAPQAEAMQEEAAPLAAAAEGENANRGFEATPEGMAESLMLPQPESTLELLAESGAISTEQPSAKNPPQETIPSSADMQLPTELATATPTATPTPWLINGTEVQGIGGGAPDTPRQTHTPTPEPSATPEPTATPRPSETPEPSPTPSDTPLPSDTASPAAEDAQMSLPAASETPVPLALQADQPTGEQPVAPVEQPAPSRQPSRPLILAIEIVLGLLAAGCAIIFFYLYRKSS